MNAERVRNASPTELDTFAERVLTARHLDDVLAGKDLQQGVR